MITDPHYVFSGFTPAGFDQLQHLANTDFCFQNKVTQKTYNELNNKYKELKILQERLRASAASDDDLKQLFLKPDVYTLMRTILKDEQMVEKLSYKLTKQEKADIHDFKHKHGKFSSEDEKKCKCNKLREKFKKLEGRQDRASVLKACQIML